jgi:MinD-like ATPase involved in chromosome partitioning or flagellar assembly
LEEVSVEEGEIIVKQGEKGDALYIIKKGKVVVLKDGVEVAKLEEGAFFGEMALIEQKPRTADVKALEPTELFKLSQEGFNFIIKSNPTILMKLVSLVTQRVREMALKEAAKEVDSQKIKIPPQKEASIISFFSAKGGVGKSYFVFQLAPYLAHLLSDKKILVWDLNLEFGCLDSLFYVKNNTTICDLIEADVSSLSFADVEPYLHTPLEDSPNLYLLTAPPSPEKSEIVTMQDIRTLLLFFKKQFDYIFIDLPNSFTDTTITALDNSNHILFFVNKEIATIRNSIRCIKLMDSLDYPEDTVKIIVNNFPTPIEIGIDIIEEKLHKKVVAELPEDRKIVFDSIKSSMPLFKNKKSFTLFKDSMLMILSSIIKEEDKFETSNKNGEKTGEGLLGSLKKIFGG